MTYMYIGELIFLCCVVRWFITILYLDMNYFARLRMIYLSRTTVALFRYRYIRGWKVEFYVSRFILTWKWLYNIIHGAIQQICCHYYIISARIEFRIKIISMTVMIFLDLWTYEVVTRISESAKPIKCVKKLLEKPGVKICRFHRLCNYPLLQNVQLSCQWYAGGFNNIIHKTKWEKQIKHDYRDINSFILFLIYI